MFYETILYSESLLERWGKCRGVSWSDIEKAENRFDKSSSDGIILFVVRAVTIVPSVAINAFCGVVRFEIKISCNNIFRDLGSCNHTWIHRMAIWKFLPIFSYRNIQH